MLEIGGSLIIGTLMGLGIYQLGKSHAQSGGMSSVAVLTASDAEAAEGYFVLGDVTLVAKQDQPWHVWLLKHRNQRIVLSADETHGDR